VPPPRADAAPAAPGAETAGAAGSPAAPAASSGADHPPLPGIDLAAALPRLGGSYAALTGLLKRFEQSHGQAVSEVRTLLAAGEHQAASQLLHRLRGVAANLGAHEIARRSAAAETLLHAALAAAEAPPPAAMAPLLEALAQAVATVADGARSLEPAAPPASPSHTMHNLPQKLAELQSLLQNNNLKATRSKH
jgi:HPt (histidine-containing phosphotransfer) domain-containing protein